MSPEKLVRHEDYEPFVGSVGIERISKKKARIHIPHVNSTYYGFIRVEEQHSFAHRIALQAWGCASLDHLR